MAQPYVAKPSSQSKPPIKIPKPKVNVAKPPKAKANAAAPNPLAPLSTAQIQQQAQKTVTSAYKPVLSDLNRQQNQAKNLDSMRSKANDAYNQWMTSQIAAIQSHNDAAQGMLTNALSANQAAEAAAMGGAATNPVQATPGSTLDPAAAGTDQGLVNATTAAAKFTAANQGNNVLEHLQSGNDLSGAVSENDFALTAANRQAQMSALDKTIQSIGNDRSKATSSEAADTQKEIARLEGVEINKAQAQENYNAAVAKLKLTGQVDQANALHQQNEDINAANQTGISKQNANTAAKRAATAAGVQPSEIARNLAAANSSNASAAKARATANGHKIATATQTSDVYNAISTVKDQIANIVKNGRTAAGKPITPAEAYHLVANGGTYYVLAPHTSTTKGVTGVNGLVPTAKTATRVPSTVADMNTILNAGLNLYDSNSINTNDLAALNSAGIYGVRARYKVHAPVKKQTGNPLLTGGAGVLAPGSTGLG